jgi:uncharacterized membrane protein YagU involved in acid resistance
MRNGFVSHTAGGALGGAVGTLFLMQSLKRASESLPEASTTPPDAADFILSRLEQAGGHVLSRPVHQGIVNALHWAYGIGWGSALGLLTARRHSVRSVPAVLLFGTCLGSAVWAVGYAGLLPATRLTPPVYRQGVRPVVTSLLGHIAYGVVSAAPLLLIDRRHKVPVWRKILGKVLG